MPHYEARTRPYFSRSPERAATMRDGERLLLVILGAGVSLLLISCANVGSLALAPAVRRVRVYAIRPLGAAGLSFLLAVHLSRPWCAWQSLLLDDPVQHIDDYRAVNLAEVITAVRRTGEQVIVAVEDPALADLLCRRLRSGGD